ncbi:hypothetical protein Emed_006824 [Eimeria media]
MEEQRLVWGAPKGAPRGPLGGPLMETPQPSSSNQTLIYQGAEAVRPPYHGSLLLPWGPLRGPLKGTLDGPLKASLPRLYLVSCFSRPYCLLKHRRPRVYIHPTLDQQLQRQRLQQEVRAMLRCRKAGIDVPHLLWVQGPPPPSVAASSPSSEQATFLGAPVGGPWGAPSQGALGAPLGSKVEEGGSRILMEWVEGCTVKALLDLLQRQRKKGETDEETIRKMVDTVAAAIGASLARMHGVGIIHGDLTTSNMMLRTQSSTPTAAAAAAAAAATAAAGDAEREGPAGLGPAAKAAAETAAQQVLQLLKNGTPPSVCLIDFGLSATSAVPEEKAVDLFVLERAAQSAHPSYPYFFSSVLAAYTAESAAAARTVCARLDAVRLRGRKRLMVG